MSDLRLQPCPFCAATDIELYHAQQHHQFYAAMCHRCHAFGPEAASLDAAEVAWNTRGTPQEAALHRTLAHIRAVREETS